MTSEPSDFRERLTRPRAGLALGAAGAVFALCAAALLWASEGARVFAEAAFSAVLACL